MISLEAAGENPACHFLFGIGQQSMVVLPWPFAVSLQPLPLSPHDLVTCLDATEGLMVAMRERLIVL